MRCRPSQLPHPRCSWAVTPVCVALSSFSRLMPGGRASPRGVLSVWALCLPGSLRGLISAHPQGERASQAMAAEEAPPPPRFCHQTLGVPGAPEPSGMWQMLGQPRFEPHRGTCKGSFPLDTHAAVNVFSLPGSPSQHVLFSSLLHCKNTLHDTHDMQHTCQSAVAVIAEASGPQWATSS